MSPLTRQQQAQTLDAFRESIERQPSSTLVSRVLEVGLLNALTAGAAALRALDPPDPRAEDWAEIVDGIQVVREKIQKFRRLEATS